ncbi:MAG: indole-3-glycerol-phosphate synthase TrpC, partial [Candidatus Sumerlaeota bacterium]|nr:indole-3-glycerol-phosphate synthase TrpC [Candidatus Sumerlaeota bacterium]
MILDEIVAYKKEFVAASKTAVPLPELKSRMGAMASSPSFSAAVKRHPNQDIKAIAEIKKASPSKGVIREDFNPIA